MTDEEIKEYWRTAYLNEKYKKEQLEKENAELKNKFIKVKELLKFWIDDFYDGFNSSKRYEERHKAIIESEQFLKENK